MATSTSKSHRDADSFLLGWATADITPDKPVVLRGQFHARVSEGVMDPVTATALALHAPDQGVILVSCDSVSISDEFRDLVRKLVREALPDLAPTQIILNATHTHTAPDAMPGSRNSFLSATERAEKFGLSVAPEWANWGVELDAMPAIEYLRFAARRVAEAAIRAWNERQPAGVSFGLGQAVVGHHRRMVYQDGRAQMYGRTDVPDFTHMEGYEDHGVNLLYAWQPDGRLTGVIVNLACPSQASEHEYQVSADFWHDVRVELRRRLGADLFILPQTSAAGDQSPHLIERNNTVARPGGDRSPENRMQRLTGHNRRRQIAVRLADAVTDVLPFMKDCIDWRPVLSHRFENLPLTRRLISQKDVDDAVAEAAPWREKLAALHRELNANPAFKQKPRWYVEVTKAFRRAARGMSVAERLKMQQSQPRMPIELHVIRLGDLALATNPFELYLDYGLCIKTRSVAAQTFLVQHTGSGGYLPTARSILGGGYGSVPASTDIGPEGGRELVERTLQIIESLWQ